MAASLFRMQRLAGSKLNVKKIHLSALCGSSETLTKVTEKNGVRRIVLNNPKKRNALSLAMLDTLRKDFMIESSADHIRCIIISSSGPVFSAGHDLKELLTENGKSYHEKVFKHCTILMKAIQTSPVPIIAEVRGLAAAAGCQLVASCDIVIASENARFSTPGANVGLFCSTPGIALSRAVPRKVSAYMLFTGHSITAEEALKSGLVSKIVPDEKLEETTDEVAQAIVSKSQAVLAVGKLFYLKQLEENIDSAYKEGENVMVYNLSLKDAQEGISAFFDKRSPNWKHTLDHVS